MVSDSIGPIATYLLFANCLGQALRATHAGNRA